MKAAYVEGSQRGHGALVFSQAIFPEGPWRVSIQRGSDQKYLTGKPQNPWTGETNYIELSGASRPDGSLELEVGPAIVDRLDQQQAYRITLKGADAQELQARLAITAINYSLSGSLDNTADLKQPEAPEPPKPAPQPQPAPAPQGAPAQEAGPAPERLDMEPQPAQKGSRKNLLRWVLLALLVLACGAWYWIDMRHRQESAGGQPQGQEAPAVAAQQSTEDQVRAFFKGGKITPKQAAELASRMRKDTPGEQDAVYRLYYFAAEGGEPSVLFDYAACLDPALPAWGSIEKDAPAAWEIYKKAPDQTRAAQAMTNLRGWLEDQAHAGNKKAEQWLAEIER